ncbi:MAG: hypothetical protein C4329_12690 [Chitinophagaceae bacterium]
MEQNRNNQQGGDMQRGSQNPQQEKNETLQDGSAVSVADYGRADQKLEEEQVMNSDRSGNSSIPMDNEETMGNP